MNCVLCGTEEGVIPGARCGECEVWFCSECFVEFRKNLDDVQSQFHVNLSIATAQNLNTYANLGFLYYAVFLTKLWSS